MPPHSAVLRQRIDPISRTNSSRLPPPSKFRSGHLPNAAIPVSRAIPAGDTESDDDDDVYGGGRYSLDSSPQDDKKFPNSNSSYSYSDVSSSMETVAGRNGNVGGRSALGSAFRGFSGGGRSVNTEEDDEESDSASSSEFSTTQTGSLNGAIPGSKLRFSEGNASTVPSQANVGSVTAKVAHPKNVQTKKCSFDGDVPSAPPFSGSGQEIKEVIDRTSELHKTPQTAESKNEYNSGGKDPVQFVRTTGGEPAISSGSNPARVPTFHASALGPWHAIIAYDGCVRLCLHAWARGCMEAPMFLENECALLRETFCVQNVLLQSEEELLAKRTCEPAAEGAAPKPRKILGKLKVQVRKVKTTLDPPTGCNMYALALKSPRLEMFQYRFSRFQSSIYTGWKAFRRIHVTPRIPANGSFKRQSLAYVQASTQYIKQVSGLLKSGVTSLRNNSSSYEVVQGREKTHSCLLRLKSASDEDAIKMQPGSGETHVFFPDSLGDDLIVEIQDSKGKSFGRVVAQVATITEDLVDKLRWWSIYKEPEHELVGKLQLYINYSTSSEDGNAKCGAVAETVAYDVVLEVAMKAQHFQQRNLLLYGSWKWLLNEFATYYGISDVYTKLRYLSYIMDVATPTADCLALVYDLLMPVIMKGHSKGMLSHQENRILGEIKDRIEQILSLVFENYKSLDETLFSGIMDVFKPATAVAASALEPAVKLYTLLSDVLSPEAQTKLTHYFQVAAKKRSRRHLSETDEYVTNNNEGILMDPIATTIAYQKMTSLCMNIKNEIRTDIEIHNQHILPSFVDLPNLSASIYSTELCSRLGAFLVSCPPSGPSPHVAELVIATSDFQREIASWSISPVKGGVDAKELFHLYIMLWIQDRRLSLLESCKLDKVKWSGVRTQHSTTPFIDEMYERLRETLDDYEIIIRRWPEYIFVLENAIADVEKAVVEALDKQYDDVLAPMKENLAPKKFGFNYVKKLTKRSVCSYTVPDELGILLNSMKRMLDILRPKIETRFKSWGTCIPDGGNTLPGERLSEVTVMLRSKFRSYLQAVVEKLAENTKLQNATKLKKILQDSKEPVGESDMRGRMQSLKEQLTNTVNHLHSVFETHVFIAICRGYWDRMGQDVLSFMENRKENRSWYKGSRVAVSVLDDTFASQMQELLGNAIQDKDVEPPRSIMEVRSMLCKDAPNHKDNGYYY
ncbi:unnamed protein product [Linum tenue]|uniref:Pesticidal crystal cry8Ba protein n=1 Tax=Linum tenue TaxID=586396 RepID=A0AAV0MPS1_9ROSI|nr:unnamed protein product [Linum tenue]